VIFLAAMLTLQLGVSCHKDVIKPICKPTDTTTNKIFNKDFEVVWENTSETGGQVNFYGEYQILCKKVL